MVKTLMELFFILIAHIVNVRLLFISPVVLKLKQIILPATHNVFS
jgi:hypothetical protein